MGCKQRKLRGSYHSFDPSQAKGPQEGSQARSQLAGPRAGMTDAGIPQRHLGPMNPQGGEQDKTDLSWSPDQVCLCQYPDTHTTLFF